MSKITLLPTQTWQTLLLQASFKSGAAHYESFGKKENRMWNIFSGMSRVDKAMSQLDKRGLGLEIGPRKRTRPSAGKVFDHISNACKRNGSIAWATDATGNLSLVHSIEQAQALWKQASSSEDYIDVHCWRFTPESFYLILSDLKMLKLTDLGILKEFKTTGFEFYVTLGKHVDFIRNDRLQMLQQSKASDGAA